jgi:hypothetical protein
MSGDLATTNLLLGIMAAVSVLEALLLIGCGVAAFTIYRRTSTLIQELEARQVAPAVARINAILDDVKQVTMTLKSETERVDQVIRTIIDRVDDTADRVKWNVRAKASRVIGLIRGVRVALETMLHTERAA